jgi:hypothetical protein
MGLDMDQPTQAQTSPFIFTQERLQPKRSEVFVSFYVRAKQQLRPVSTRTWGSISSTHEMFADATLTLLEIGHDDI